MKIIADTNVLLRLFITNDPEQQALAFDSVESAERVAVSIVAICELVWVLERSYGAPRDAVAATLRRLLAMPKLMVDRPMVEAGLALLDTGGDFAEAVIAFDGQRLGGTHFISFDKKAVKRLSDQGVETRLLA